MKTFKLILKVAYLLIILVFFALKLWSMVAGVEFILSSYFYWLELLGLILLAWLDKIKINVFFEVSISLFIISFAIFAVGLIGLSEFVSEVSLVIFTLAVFLSVLSMIKHANS